MSSLTRLLAALAIAMAGSNAANAQTGVLVVAHGAGPEWNNRVLETVSQVRWTGPVATAFLMGPGAERSGFEQAVTTLVADGAQDIVIVPLMVSSWGSHFRQVRYYAGELPELPAELRGHDHGPRPSWPVPMRVTPALDDAPELGLAVAAMRSGLDDVSRTRPLFFVAHGPNADSDAVHWLQNAGRVLDGLGSTPAVRVALLRDDAPAPVRAEAVAAMRRSIVELAEAARDSVTVLPLLISTGQITAVKIPADLADLPIRYVQAALNPSPHLAAWIERMAREAITPTELAPSRNARSDIPRPDS